MAVYVDNWKQRYGRMIMCHMVADDLEELHAMADKIGLRRKWFQGKASFPHYDVSLSKKSEAVAHGAIAITWRELGTWMREKKKQLATPATDSEVDDE